MKALRAEALQVVLPSPTLPSVALTHAFAPGKISVLVGPSGAGKTTVLNALAGLLPVASGRLWFGGDDITAVPAERRNFGYVFQDHALFPHLTVAGNVEFGLRLRRWPKAARRQRTAEMLEFTRIAHLRRRAVHHLSGGERQRVALARALAPGPDVLLMDEPLSAIDPLLREGLRDELRALVGTLALTTVYVTHDRDEALSLADELLVCRAGKLEQAGAPADVYARPANPFVAAFVGPANLWLGRCTETGAVELAFGTLPMAEVAPGPVCVMVRPEDLSVGTPADFWATVERVDFLGARRRVHARANGTGVILDLGFEEGGRWVPGQTVPVRLCAESLRWWPGDAGSKPS